MTAPHQPTPAGRAEPPGGEEELPPVADPATGAIRLLSRRCATCILNPAPTRIRLEPDRLRGFLAADPDGHVVCHATLPEFAPADTEAAICRGYTDAYGLPSLARAVLRLGIGHLVEVPPPTEPPGPPHPGAAR